MLNRRWVTFFVLIGLFTMAPMAEARVILWEDFSTSYNGSLPVGWEVVDNLTEAPIWDTDNYCIYSAYSTPWNLIVEPFAAADNACRAQGFPDVDTDIISNDIDLSLFTDVSITFDADCRRAFPSQTAFLDPDTSVEVYDGATWTSVAGYDPVDDTYGNDESFPFDISALADGNDGFALRWNFSAVTGDPDLQTGWCVIDNILVEGECPDTTSESLIVDDGAYDDVIPADGYDTAYVTCIEPTVYPSYLTEISAFFIDPPRAVTGSSDVHFAVFRGEIVDGPEPYPLWEGDDFVPAPGSSGQWYSEDLTGEAVFDNPLTYGAWCLGVVAPYAEFQDQYLGIDDSISGNSWQGNVDGPFYWQSFVDMQINANAMIRGEAEYCVEGTTTTTTTTIPATTTTTTTTPPTTTTTTVTTTTTSPTTTTTTQPPNDDVDDDDDAEPSVSPPEEDGLGGGSFDFGCNN